MVDAEAQAAVRPFRHVVPVQPTTFRPVRAPDADKRVGFQALYQDLVVDQLRNRLICNTSSNRRAHVRIRYPPKHGSDELVNALAGLEREVGQSHLQRGVHG